MAKERVAKWAYDQTTSILSLLNAKTSETVWTVNLAEEVEGFVDLPEYERFYFVYGLKQKIADPNAGEKGQNKLEGMILAAKAFKEVTFARAATERKVGLGMLGMISMAKTKQNLEFVQACIEAEGKELPKEFEAKWKEITGKDFTD